ISGATKRPPCGDGPRSERTGPMIAACGTSVGARAWPLPLVVALLVVGVAGVALERSASPPPVLRSVGVGQGPSALAVGADSGHVFVANYADGSVSVLDARSGELLRTVPVGTFPDAVAVAERTGRVFVANMGDASVSVLDAHSGTLLRTTAVGQGPE